MKVYGSAVFVFLPIILPDRCAFYLKQACEGGVRLVCVGVCVGGVESYSLPLGDRPDKRTRHYYRYQNTEIREEPPAPQQRGASVLIPHPK